MNDLPNASPHDGPAPYVPISAGAVTALVLAIVLAILAFIGPFWCPIVAILVAAVSFGAIARRVRRGRVIALLAIVISAGGAAGAYVYHRHVATTLATGFSPIVRALDHADRAGLAKLAGEGPARATRFENWLTRAKAATDELGPMSGDLTLPVLPWGAWAALVSPPDGLVEFEPKGAAPPSPGTTFWFRATYAKGDVHVAFDFGSPEKFQAALVNTQSEQLPASTNGEATTLDTRFAGRVEDVRYFR